MSELNLILLGPPGAGKGTQAARLRDQFGLTHVSTGDMLRRHRASATDLGLEAAEYMASGRLLPDSLVISTAAACGHDRCRVSLGAVKAFHGAYRADGRSRPAFDPAMMVALILYACARATRSTRAIERACV